MFLKMSAMLDGATNLVRSVTNVTGSNAATTAIDNALSTLKSKSDGAAGSIDSAENNMTGVGDAYNDMKDTMKK
ncbi:hypothetical protein F1188_12000 [Roseospira marina]|uniref:Uncharacterized protein n=1 Tax=Roseospira marina TaxID=140057 RepID=A0A5M6IAI7_9PROT|nr:hypothetical protein [Roseospira marina]KAA5605284.1 hypothetical protein F1188_12000 [Roseospira marina]MBB4314745.1 hypothetical protein [Roseospira marina]MBB5087734.1 hypothetical protein [Roseospira marina]